MSNDAAVTLARLSALPRPLAFVLPGGGALGAWQVGILKALTEQGVKADMLVGVSAGAVNASLFAWNSDPDAFRRLEHIWRTIRRRDLLRVNPARIALAIVGRRPSFITNRHGEDFLRRHLGHRLLEDAPIELAIVATDLASGRAVLLDRGEAVSAVLASTAFPGVYPPVHRDGKVLVDGGVVADIALDQAVELGARSAVVVSVPPLAPGPAPRHAIDAMFRASTFGVEAHGRTVLARPPHGLEVVDIPTPPSDITTFAVGRTGSIIDEAYAHTTRWLLGGQQHP
jgi:NTE family protein